MPTNDNDSRNGGALPEPPDAHGQAALLLVESLIHGLCEKATLSADEAIEIADRAVSVQRDMAEAAGGSAAMWQSHALLSSIAASLRFDASDGQAPPSTLRPV